MTANSAQVPKQLVLELPHRQALGAEDFLVSRSNAAAVQHVDLWPSWPHPAVLLIGPKGAGKSHLAHVWQLKSDARVIAGAEVTDAAIREIESKRALVVEDIDRGIGSEQTLFHLLNLAREKGYSILLTSRRPPGEIDVTLPDLRSRLRALPLLRIEPPDEGLLKAVLVKLFSDRQLAVEPHVVGYLALHMERSMEAVNQVVAETDRLSLARQRAVTRTIAAEALASLGVYSDGD